jgi:methylase of polypeptide subunit release factors
LLEIGVGNGVTMIEALLAGKCDHAMGTDISENAVLNTRYNLRKYGLS